MFLNHAGIAMPELRCDDRQRDAAHREAAGVRVT